MGNSSSEPLIVVDPTSPHVKRILEAREKLTGWERIKNIFKLDEFGNVSPEIHRFVTATSLGMFAGAMMGALGRGRIAYQNYMRTSMHEVFNTPLEAKRKLQDNVTLGMGSGAYRVGWRMGLFTGMYMGVTTLVATYRGKSGVIDQVAGAGIAGFMYKFAQGPKAAISGLVIGSLIGTFAGIMTLGITKLSGTSIDTANLHYYEMMAKKEENEAAAFKAGYEFVKKFDRTIESAEEDTFSELSEFHDELFAKLGGLENVKINNTEAVDNSSQKQLEIVTKNSVVSAVKVNADIKSSASSNNDTDKTTKTT